MAAKITLACLSKVLDERWLDTAEAAKYRGWLWNATPVNDDGSPALGFPSSASEMDRHVLDPPEHLLYFAPLRKGRVGLSMAYFGSIIVRSGIDIGDLAMPANCMANRPRRASERDDVRCAPDRGNAQVRRDGGGRD